MSNEIIESTPPCLLPVSWPEIVQFFERTHKLYKKISDADTIQLESFYFPIIGLAYTLIKTACNKIDSLPEIVEKETHRKDFYFYLARLGQLIELILFKMSHDNPVYDQFLVFYLQEYFQVAPFQWNTFVLNGIAHWLFDIVNIENHIGIPPSFVYIKSSAATTVSPLLPKLLEKHNWRSGFGGKLIILIDPEKMSSEQKAHLWNYLLVEKQLYDDEKIDHSVRELVFNEIVHQFPEGNVRHLDLCGGRGDFIQWLHVYKPDTVSVLIDIADKAVEIALNRNIQAAVGNAEKPLQIESPVDIITIIFALHWLTDEALANAFNALKPNGKLIANIYPPGITQTETNVTRLTNAGFTVEHQIIQNPQGNNQFVVVATKPEN